MKIKIMLRLTILIVAILNMDSVIGQNYYKMEYTYSLSGPNGGAPMNFNSYRITMEGSGNSLLYYNETTSRGDYDTKSNDLLINLNYNPNNIEFIAQYGDGGEPSGCNAYNVYNINYDYANDIFIPIPTDNNCVRPSGAGILWRVKELNGINGTNSFSGCESKIIKVSSVEFFMSYKVDYQIGNGPWLSFLPYARRSTDFEIQESDFQGISPTSTFKLKVGYESGFNAYSKILPLTFASCSPQVVNIDGTDTKCSYSKDGEITFTFNRPLNPGEDLQNLSLRYASSNAIYQTESVATYNGNQFIWPQLVREGTYILEYQSGNTGSPVISDPITINNGPVLTYSITANDISCFNENDGEIIITINPNNNGSIGTPPYKYTINGGAAINFSGTNTSIPNLGPNDYNIQVFDQNNCTERQ